MARPGAEKLSSHASLEGSAERVRTWEDRILDLLTTVVPACSVQGIKSSS